MIRSTLAHQPAHGGARPKNLGQLRARIKRTKREVRIFPAPGALPFHALRTKTSGGATLPSRLATRRRGSSSGRCAPQLGLPSLLAPSRTRGDTASNAALPGHDQCPHRSGHRGRMKDPEYWATLPALVPCPKADLILKGLVSLGSRGHRGSGEPGETWHCRPLAEVPGPADRGSPLRSRGRAALARPPSPGSAPPAPWRTPPAARVFLFPLAASLPPTLRNSSSTCPTGWSTPERLRPHLAPGPPPTNTPQPPLLLKAKLLSLSCFPEELAGRVTSPPRRRLCKGVAGKSPRLTPLDRDVVRKSHV